jgi:hypothetical protein
VRLLLDAYSALFTEGNYVTVDIPVGAPDSSGITPFVPVDSVFQTQDESYVFIVQDNHAAAKKVRLGSVQGQFVSVEEGLGNNDQVITDRNVVEGDQVQVTQ